MKSFSDNSNRNQFSISTKQNHKKTEELKVSVPGILHILHHQHHSYHKKWLNGSKPDCCPLFLKIFPHLYWSLFKFCRLTVEQSTVGALMFLCKMEVHPTKHIPNQTQKIKVQPVFLLGCWSLLFCRGFVFRFLVYYDPKIYIYFRSSKISNQ